MAKKKPKNKEEKPPPQTLGEMPMRDLLKSIRDDLAEKAKQAGLAGPENPPKLPKSR